MMEFTVSRIVLCICGAVLLSAGISIADAGCDQRELSDLESAGNNIARILDDFWYSDLESITITGDIIPLPECTVSVSHGTITVVRGDLRYDTVTSYPGTLTLNYGKDTVISHRTFPQSCVRYRRIYPSRPSCCIYIPKLWHFPRFLSIRNTGVYNAYRNVSLCLPCCPTS